MTDQRMLDEAIASSLQLELLAQGQDNVTDWIETLTTTRKDSL